MSFIEREHNRLMEFCQNTSPGPAYEAAYAAKQALAWAMDPDAVASPSAQIGRHYSLDIIGTVGTGVVMGVTGLDGSMPPSSPN